LTDTFTDSYERKRTEMSKRILKKAFGAVLAFSMCAGLMSAAAFADDNAPETAIRPSEEMTISEGAADDLNVTPLKEGSADSQEAETPDVKEPEIIGAQEPGASDRPVLLYSDQDVERIYKNVGDAQYAYFNENIPKYGYDLYWYAMELARAGYSINQAYLDDVYRNVEEKKGVLHTSKYNYTEYAKAVLTLTACGVDPHDIAGYDLLQPLADYDAITAQGVNGVIYALLALDCHRYEIPAAPEGIKQATRENLIAAILDARLSDGGWDYAGKIADPDLTAMALQALAPYYHSEAYPEVTAVIDEVLELMSTSMQTEEGRFCSPDAGGKPTSESSAQVIVALTALGIDPDKDARFIKNGFSAIDGLCDFWTDGGFKHVLDPKQGINALATIQGYYALVSYMRVSEGKTSLYDMTEDLPPVIVYPLKSAVLSGTVFTYTGSAIKPDVTVKAKVDGKTKTLKKGTDYKVSYKNNKKVGTASVTVTGIGNYTGTITKNFRINPTGVSFSSVTGKKQSLTLKWAKKKPEATGYQYQVSISKNFPSDKTTSKKVLIAKESKSTITKTVTGLKSGKTYYARIRSYTVTGGKTYYSEWSAATKAAVK